MQGSIPSTENFDFRWQESGSVLLSRSSFYLKLLQYASFLYTHSTYFQLSPHGKRVEIFRKGNGQLEMDKKSRLTGKGIFLTSKKGKW